MDYIKAVAAREIINELEQNNKDIQLLRNPIENNIESAQIVFRRKDGSTCMTTIYEINRLPLLAQILLDRNEKLMAKLENL